MGQMQFIYGNDPGMPALGTLGVGDLVAALDAALVNGGTTQSITSITRSGTTATATKTAHGLRHRQMVTISGASQADYNGTFRITRIDANTFSYTVANSPATPATGTILAKIAALGWGTAFTGTNTRSYRAPSGLRHYLEVSDNSNTNTAIVRAFTAMTAVTTGTGPFPTTAQSVTNLKWPRPDPTTYSSTSAPNDSWCVVGDEKRFFLGICAQSTGYRFWFGFGEFQSYKAADAYNTFFFGAANTDGTDSLSCSSFIFNADVPSTGTLQFFNSYCAVARCQDQTTLALCAGIMTGWLNTSPEASNYCGSTSAGNSSPISGGIEMTPIEIIENVGTAYWRRGRLPCFATWSPADFTNNDSAIYTGVTNFPELLAVRGFTSNPASGLIFPVNDWDTVLS